MTRVSVSPKLLTWARARAGMTQEDLAAKFKHLPAWESGEKRPTLKQVEAFARSVHVPFGYLFLTEPPKETLPIPDFRTVAGRPVTHPSPDLLATIYACQERQDWYRDFARANGLSELPFIGRATLETASSSAAADMRATLNFDLAVQRGCPNWSEALRQFIRRIEAAGVMVMVNGVVASNTHRRLDPEEFRGFALADRLAPLIFVNGADTKAAQMFTLAHELAHLWLGATALSNSGAKPEVGARREEVWCNAVAAEFLVPLADLSVELRTEEALDKALERLPAVFKVSTLVILRRLLDVGRIDRGRFEDAWAREIARDRDTQKSRGEGTSITRRLRVLAEDSHKP